jgi:hypothetical protein
LRASRIYGKEIIMLLFIIAIAVGFLIGLDRSTGKGKVEAILRGCLTASLCALGYLGILLILIIPFAASEKQYVEGEKAEIVSLRNFLKLEGDFFLLFGSIDSVPHYAYYYRTSRGGLKLNVLPAKDAEVFEEKRPNAFISKVSKEINHPGLEEWDWLVIPKFMVRCSDSSGYAFHVPEGSVKKDISLDLQRLKP